jgi:cyclopropane fatty-acyl-phospholipid synthase-like methyltransferase
MTNKKRYPNIQFYNKSIQSFSPKNPFDFISSVTVIQHIPFNEQEIVIKKIRELIKTNGYVILLENISHQGPHVFSNNIKEWQNKFEKAGFRCLAIQRYDYSPFNRINTKILKSISSKLSPDDNRGLISYANDLPNLNKPSKNGNKNLMQMINSSIRRFNIYIDSLVEPLLIRSNLNITTIHCGFLFRAV